MNPLGRDIRPGEEVIIDEGFMQADYKDLEKRVFICESGFGLSNATAGVKIFGYFKSDGDKSAISSPMINARETRAHQKAQAQNE